MGFKHNFFIDIQLFTQRLERLDTLTIRQEVGNIQNELSIDSFFSIKKILDFTPRLIVLCKLPLLFIKRT